jgi:hypothetical protein
VSAVLSPQRWLALGAAVLLAATVAMLPLAVLSRLQFDAVVALVIGVPCGVVGLLVARRQPGDPLDAAGAELAGVIQSALEPAALSLWISGGAR